MRRMLCALAGMAALALFLALPGLLPAPAAPANAALPASTPAPAPVPSAAPAPTPTPTPYRAVWVSYLEWQAVDFSSSAAFAADSAAMLDGIAALGATVVLAQVRPFGDALYPSAYFPFSHLCTGTQGQNPGFDPLALFVDAAHARGLQVEAWVNPYRLQQNGVPALCAQSPALLHPDWVKEADGGLYLDPASPAVRQYIADGVAELCGNYPLDGIHFDDYFYPTADPAFDAADYAAYQAGGGALALEDWRRQNVDGLVALCWRTVHQTPGVRFGIAPQGRAELDYGSLYCDTALWLAEPGYVDYLMPQLYWGLASPRAALRADVLAAAWAALPRAAGVALYAGLGAFRLGDGEGGTDTASLAEWQSGAALAAQVRAVTAAGAEGVALYRYGSLFANAAWPDLAAKERAALAALWHPKAAPAGIARRRRPRMQMPGSVGAEDAVHGVDERLHAAHIQRRKIIRDAGVGQKAGLAVQVGGDAVGGVPHALPVGAQGLLLLLAQGVEPRLRVGAQGGAVGAGGGGKMRQLPGGAGGLEAAARGIARVADDAVQHGVKALGRIGGAGGGRVAGGRGGGHRRGLGGGLGGGLGLVGRGGGRAAHGGAAAHAGAGVGAAGAAGQQRGTEHRGGKKG